MTKRIEWDRRTKPDERPRALTAVMDCGSLVVLGSGRKEYGFIQPDSEALMKFRIGRQKVKEAR